MNKEEKTLCRHFLQSLLSNFISPLSKLGRFSPEERREVVVEGLDITFIWTTIGVFDGLICEMILLGS